MPPHLQLPEPRRLDSRRSGGGGNNTDKDFPDPRVHGGVLREQIERATLVPSQAPSEGVDPRAVFKVRAKPRLKLEQRGLYFLGDTADWRYFVVPDDPTATKFLRELGQYETGDGPKVLREFFGNIEGIERYGPSDRASPGLPTADFSGVTLVDVLLWQSNDEPEAQNRLRDVFTAVHDCQGEIIDSDARPLSTMARVRVPPQGLDALLNLMVVERVCVPAAPFLEPSDWLAATSDDLTAGVPIDVTVGVIDDGVHSAHPLLRDIVVSECAIPGAAVRQFFDDKHRYRAFGYGIPERARAVDSDRNRVVLIHEGEIDVDTVAIHPIPIPENFTTGKSDWTITVAVACDPPVRRQRREYTAGRFTLDFYRAADIDEVEAWVRQQPRNGSTPLPRDRRRIANKLKPGTQLCGASTLQVRKWSASSANALDPDDSDTDYLVVRHSKERWASNLSEAYETQKYALAVQLEDRSCGIIDLYADLQTQVRVQAQATA